MTPDLSKTQNVDTRAANSAEAPVAERNTGALRRLTRWGIPAVFLAIGLLLVSVCPPLWRDHDGLVQISDRPGDMVIIHYPPLYPLFSRLHVYAADIVDSWVHGHHANIHFGKVVRLNDGGIHALMVTQEILLTLALTALVWQAARSWGARWALAALLVTNASLFIIANLVSTEALAEPLTIALVAAALYNFRTPELRVGGAILYAFALFAAILTRHAHEVFALLLPLAFLLRAVIERWRAGRFPRGLLQRCGIFIVIGVLCIFAANGTIRLLCHIFDVRYRSIAARAAVERLGFVRRLPPEERETLLARLQSQTNDPVEKEAIPLLARNATWLEQRDVIENILVRDSPGLSGDALKVKADAHLERITNLYFQTHHPALIKGTLNATWRGLTATTPTDLATYFLENGAASIDLYASHPNLSKKTSDLRVCSPEMKARIASFEKNPWLQIWAWLPHGFLLFGGIAIAIYLLLRGNGDAVIPAFVLAVACTGLVVTLFTFYFVNFHPRRTAATDVFAFMTVGILLAHAIDSRKKDAKGSLTTPADSKPLLDS